jgi:DNA-binding MarR family transcriptional regulator
MPASQHSLTYVKFLHLADALRQGPSAPGLDSLEERLLNSLAAAWHTGRRIKVLEVARLLPDTSERTIFRRLKTLEDKGLITFMTDPQDHRVRHVLPTAKTDAYFASLGECLSLAQQA